MPITQWSCPACGEVVALDHFATTSCGGVVHPDYAAAVLADREAQEGREGVRVSMASSCPRKAAIMAAQDVAVDPLGMLSPLKGTAWHGLMQYAADMDVQARPEGVGAEVLVQGELGGVPVSGRIDRVLVREGKIIGQDWKTGSDFRVKFIKPSAKSPDARSPVEYQVQLSLYADLYRQQFGKQWDSAEIWWAFSGDMWRESVAIMSVEDCLNHTPNDCGFTVLQLLKQADAATSGAVQWSDLPMVGQAIKFGSKTGCDYCPVRTPCWVQHQGADF